jgi:hypothetical protein
MRFIILFLIFIHTITPTLILLFVITNSYFCCYKTSNLIGTRGSIKEEESSNINIYCVS